MVSSVLLVEDVRFTRAMTRRIIAGAVDGGVYEAASGPEALEALQARADIEVVVADISLPGMTGLEILKAVRTGKSAAARDLPFIIVSGSVTEPVRGALEALDVTAVIAKPVRRDDLLAQLARIDTSAGDPPPAADYGDVDVAGLLQAGGVAASPAAEALEDADACARFLETVPALEGMDLASLRQLAERARVLHFPERTTVAPEDLAAERLLIIARGEAEVLRTARSPHSGAMELRIDLLEAGHLLGITAFMSLPGDAEHSQIRTTRATDVLAFDFAAAAGDAELARLRDEVKLSVSRTLAHRLTHSDEAKAETLAQRLAETSIKRAAGGFVIMQVSALALYTLVMRLLLDFDVKGPERGLASIVMILVALVPLLVAVRTGPFSFAELGLTWKGARAAVREAVAFSAVFLAALIALKYVLVTFVPAHQANAVFELSQTYLRLDAAGRIDWPFYLMHIGIYALFVPVQEIVVRCGMQALIAEFLYGSARFRATVAILVSNMIFAAAHTHLNVGISLATFAVGIYFGWLFYRRRSVVGVSVAHFMIGAVGLFALDLESFLG